MPRQVFEIFLSSTSRDLKDHRSKVAEMVSRMRQTTIRMETFGARAAKPFDACRDEVEKCDALIVVVGHRNGWVPTKADGGDDHRSITWWEVQWALDSGKPVYAFLIDPGAQWTGEREQDRLVNAKDEKEFVEIGRAVNQLQNFRTFLEERTTRELFRTVDDLGGKVVSSLHDWLLEHAAAAARARYAEHDSMVVPPVATAASGGEQASDGDHIFWQEQAHIISARALAGGGKGVKVGLIAGRPKLEHPALKGSVLKYFDARPKATAAAPDDYTTSLASVLVGGMPCPGVSPNSELFVVQALDERGSTSLANILTALDVAVREGVQVICLPFGGGNEASFAQVASTLEALGILVICGAGNDGQSVVPNHYPAAMPTFVSAAAVDREDRLAFFSNFGAWVTCATPGVDLPVAVGSDVYERRNGTSYSAAILTGVVALMLALNARLTADQAKSILRTAGRGVLGHERSSAGPTLRVVDAYQCVQESAKTASSSERRSESAKSRRRSPRSTKTVSGGAES